MQPFLEVPMGITNSEGKEKEVLAKIQPSEIAYWYPGFHWGVVCVMKSGSSFLVQLPPDQFEATLEGYHKFTASNPGKYGTIRSTPKPTLHAPN